MQANSKTVFFGLFYNYTSANQILRVDTAGISGTAKPDYDQIFSFIIFCLTSLVIAVFTNKRKR